MATRRKVASNLPITEDLFMEFLKKEKVLKAYPFLLNRATSTELMIAASWLLNLLQRLNDFLLEAEKNDV